MQYEYRIDLSRNDDRPRSDYYGKGMGMKRADKLFGFGKVSDSTFVGIGQEDQTMHRGKVGVTSQRSNDPTRESFGVSSDTIREQF
ncbi:hypothetical protein MLD52_01060 [Puniceicoccaceae bacterium K14]|nr:hypothetical protein [Puniceicoccaceae bacterium K14]